MKIWNSVQNILFSPINNQQSLFIIILTNFFLFFKLSNLPLSILFFYSHISFSLYNFVFFSIIIFLLLGFFFFTLFLFSIWEYMKHWNEYYTILKLQVWMILSNILFSWFYFNILISQYFICCYNTMSKETDWKIHKRLLLLGKRKIKSHNK